jgi:hypothetical protein
VICLGESRSGQASKARSRRPSFAMRRETADHPDSKAFRDSLLFDCYDRLNSLIRCKIPLFHGVANLRTK